MCNRAADKHKIVAKIKIANVSLRPKPPETKNENKLSSRREQLVIAFLSLREFLQKYAKKLRFHKTAKCRVVNGTKSNG